MVVETISFTLVFKIPAGSESFLCVWYKTTRADGERLIGFKDVDKLDLRFFQSISGDTFYMEAFKFYQLFQYFSELLKPMSIFSNLYKNFKSTILRVYLYLNWFSLCS